MICPECQNVLEEPSCPECGWDGRKFHWDLLGHFSTLDHPIIEGLLQSYGIPVKSVKREISQFPVGVGPLAEVTVFVPDRHLAEARELLIPPEDSA